MASKTNSIINGLWIGSRLSTIGQLTIKSFMANGHHFRLFAYGAISGVPTSCEICNAEAILPANGLPTYTEAFPKNNPAAFSDLFRYELLFQLGGWWSDMDVVCIRPFAFAAPHVFSYQWHSSVGTSLIKAPRGSPIMRSCADQAAERMMQSATLRWGDIGPKLLTRQVKKFEMESFVLDPETFYPIEVEDFPELINGACPKLSQRTFAVHLWNEMWRAYGLDPEAAYGPCLFEEWKERYAIRRNEDLILRADLPAIAKMKPNIRRKYMRGQNA